MCAWMRKSVSVFFLGGVKDSAICEHVYAPLSWNPYMFEWQGRLKARSRLDE